MRTMNSPAVSNLARMLGVDAPLLLNLDEKMSEATGKSGALDFIFEKNRQSVDNILQKINDGVKDDAFHTLSVLRKTIFSHEEKLKKFLNDSDGADIFKKMANLAIRIVKIRRGFFLKKEKIKNILISRPSFHLMEYLGYQDMDSLVAKEDLIECFSALRFMETDEWMHETFEKFYSNLLPSDFEEREIEVRVLDSKWQEVAEKFVAKKHHNVSHLKEFGVIFLNPISEGIPGKILRDFLLLLHYFHEIEFYSKLFKKYSDFDDFSGRFKALLRGDVKKTDSVSGGQWLIVQRYLAKENPNDKRLFLPRVNPEALHWLRGERDFGEYFKKMGHSDLGMWSDIGWTGAFFKKSDKEEFLSFDIEDNAMSVVAFMEGRGLEQFFTYHQREALWTKIFQEYAGGEENMEKLLIDNFDKGVIEFK